MSFHINGTEGTGRTEVFAGTATDAAFRVDGRKLERVGVLGVRRYHGDGTCGTMACTVTAFHLIGLHHAVAFDPYGVPYLDGRFLGQRSQMDGVCRTDLSTFCAFRATIAAFVRRERLHQRHQAGRGAQHLVGAYRHAELAGRAVLGEVAGTLGSRRQDGCLAAGYLLVFDGRAFNTAAEAANAVDVRKARRELPSSGFFSVASTFVLEGCA